MSRYTIQRDAIVPRFPYIVVNAAGEPAVWRPDPKVGRVPMRFRSASIAQAVADKLNATTNT